MAVALLAVVMMSLAGGISQSIHLESFSKQSNAAFLLANAQIEAIRTALQTNPAATSFTDADGSTVYLTVNSPQIVDRQDNIDFSLPVPSGYKKLVLLNSSAQTSGQAETYDVRWNVQQVWSGSSSMLLLTVGVRPQAALDSNPVNLHALLP